MNDLWSVDSSGKMHIYLHPGQARAWNSEKRFVTVCAGTQSGKTSLGPLWLYREIQRCGPGDYLVAAPTFPLLSLKLLPEFRRFFEQHGQFGKYVGNPVKVFTFSREGAKATFGKKPDVPTQVFFGHAQDPDSLESATAKAAWLDEAGQKKFKRGSWEAVLRRLSIYQGRILTTTTPYDAFGWLKSELHDRAKDGDPEYDWINFDSLENPLFPRAEWDRARSSMPAWKFDLFYRGILTRPAGMIYDCWNDDYSVPDFAIPAEWPRFLGLDFGGVNTAAVLLARDGETYYLYREYHAGERTAAEHVRALKMGETQTPTACGGAKSEGQWRSEFRAAGLPIREPPISDVEVGIGRVYGLISSGRLRILESCEGVIGDITSYSRETDDAGEPTEVIADKSSSHFADSLRYIASYVEDMPRAHSGIIVTESDI